MLLKLTPSTQWEVMWWYIVGADVVVGVIKVGLPFHVVVESIADSIQGDNVIP